MPGTKSKLITPQEEFIKELRSYIDYWEKTDKDVRGKMEGLVFTILVLLDGENSSMGPFSVRPIDEHGKEGEDISGDLHDLFYNV